MLRRLSSVFNALRAFQQTLVYDNNVKEDSRTTPASVFADYLKNHYEIQTSRELSDPTAIEEVVLVSDDLSYIQKVMRESTIYSRISEANTLVPSFIIASITNHCSSERFNKELCNLTDNSTEEGTTDDVETYLRLYRLMDAISVITPNKEPQLLIDYAGSLLKSVWAQRYAVLREYDTTRTEHEYMMNA